MISEAIQVELLLQRRLKTKTVQTSITDLHTRPQRYSNANPRNVMFVQMMEPVTQCDELLICLKNCPVASCTQLRLCILETNGSFNRAATPILFFSNPNLLTY